MNYCRRGERKCKRKQKIIFFVKKESLISHPFCKYCTQGVEFIPYTFFFFHDIIAGLLSITKLKYEGEPLLIQTHTPKMFQMPSPLNKMKISAYLPRKLNKPKKNQKKKSLNRSSINHSAQLLAQINGK